MEDFTNEKLFIPIISLEKESKSARLSIEVLQNKHPHLTKYQHNSSALPPPVALSKTIVPNLKLPSILLSPRATPFVLLMLSLVSSKTHVISEFQVRIAK